MEEERKIYIGNLDYSLTEEELKKSFEEKGLSVKEIKVVRDRFSGKSKGFAFAEFENDEDAQKAIDSLNGQEIKSRKIRVSKALRRESKFDRPNNFRK